MARKLLTMSIHALRSSRCLNLIHAGFWNELNCERSELHPVTHSQQGSTAQPPLRPLGCWLPLLHAQRRTLAHVGRHVLFFQVPCWLHMFELHLWAGC